MIRVITKQGSWREKAMEFSIATPPAEIKDKFANLDEIFIDLKYIDVDGRDLDYIKRNTGNIPFMKSYRGSTRYRGEMAHFILDNIVREYIDLSDQLREYWNRDSDSL